MKNILLAAFVLIALNSCGHKKDVKVTDAVLFPPPVVKAYNEVVEKNVSGNSDPNANTAIGSSDIKSQAKLSPPGDVVEDTSKKITKEGTIKFETGDLNAARKKILTTLKRFGGYVDEDDQTTNAEDGNKQYELQIRIPANNFDLFLDSVSSTAVKLDTKSITITDVTKEYIDMKTRLDNKKILEKRYLELLSKAAKMSDMLDIEEKLTDIRSDIESTQGQLNYLNKQIAYSSLDITFYTTQPAQVNTGDGFGYKFKAAIADGWHILQNLFFGLIGLWPLFLLLLVLYIAIKIWRKRRKAKREVQ